MYSKYSKVNHLQPNCNANKYKKTRFVKKYSINKELFFILNHLHHWIPSWIAAAHFIINRFYDNDYTNKKKYDNIDS
jgi:hypothetical protein